jgi:uncharacterized protein (DUF2267 family)
MEVDMTYDQFVGEVQARAKLGSQGASVRAIEATLGTLAERLDPGECKDLASQLPRELAGYLQANEHGVRMSLDDFFHKVSEREHEKLPPSVYHARVVMEVLQEAVSRGEIADVRAQLPEEWMPLFAGSQGPLRAPAARR